MIEVAAGLTIDRENPWPGLSAFDEAAEPFFNGRFEESAALRRLVMQAPLTVLFGTSGLGKTSLLQAGLFPLLRINRHLPVYVRLDLRDRTAPLIDQARSALQREIGARHVDAPGWVHGEALWDYLHRAGLELWSEQNRLLTPVFVFDQFEEVFTLGPSNADAVARLRIDLADLIENRMPEPLTARLCESEAAGRTLSLDAQRYKVLLSFREDFLPMVEGLKRRIPSIMRNRLRLLPMSEQQAFEAVHSTAPHLADEQMARRIVEFVAGREEMAPAWEADTVEASDVLVEPALLSLVCRGLNEKRKAQRKTTFDAALLRGTGKEIVKDFYRDATKDMPVHIRRFIEGELITERGFRKPCDVDDAQKVHGVSGMQLRLLVDRRLLRIEPARGTDFVELTHDLLTPVVREHRDRDREEQRIAKEKKRRRRQTFAGIALGIIALVSVGLAVYFQSLRETAVRNADQLRRTADQLEVTLKEAQRQTDAAKAAQMNAANALVEARNANEKAEALAKSEMKLRDEAEERGAQLQEQTTQLQEKTTQLEAQTASTKLALANEVEAKEKATILQGVAKQNELAAKANATKAKQAEDEAKRQRNVSIAQGLVARVRLLQREEDLPLVSQMVVHAFVKHSGTRCTPPGSAAEPCRFQQFDRDLLSLLQTTFNRLTAKNAGEAPGSGGILTGTGGGPVLRIIGSGARLQLISGRPGRGLLQIDLPAGWREIGGPPASVRSIPISMDRRVTALAVAGSGTEVATGNIDGILSVWSLNPAPAPWLLDSSRGASITAAAFMPDEHRVVLARSDGSLTIRDERTIVTTVGLSGTPVRALLPIEGGVVLIATSRGIFRWTPEQMPLVLEGTAKDDVQSMALSSDRRRLAFGRRDGRITLAAWTGSSLGGRRVFDELHDSPVNALAFSPGGHLLASAGADGTVRLFPFADDGSVDPPAVLAEHRGWVESLGFADDRLLYSAGADGTVRVWLTQVEPLVALICREVARNKLYPLDTPAENVLAPLLQERSQNACTLVDTDGRVVQRADAR